MINSIITDEWKLVFKIIGLICILVSAFAYGEYKQTQGRMEQCLIEGKFLLDDNICHDSKFFEAKGYYIDKDCKCLRPILENKSYNININ